VVDISTRIHQLKGRIDHLRSEWLPHLRNEWLELAERRPRLARSLLVSVGVIAALSIVGPVWYFIDLQKGLPDKAGIARIVDMDQATAVYDDRDELVFTIFKQRRMDAPLSSVSPHLIQALLAIEDQRFYDHGGFDFGRTVGAALANLRHNRALQGGSTITQQLARQTFLSSDKTIRRKLQEVILARRIESQFSKDEILGLYLNKVYFGDGLYGVKAASQGYFDKSPAELSLSEAALLAGLVKAPSSYAPTVNMDRAIARRNVVLQAMLDNGALDRAAWQNARATKVVLHDGLPADEPHGQYFKEEVRQELVERFGWERVYQGGLRVYSTINMPMQEAAEAAAAETLKSIDARRKKLEARRAAATKRAPRPDPSPLQAALVAMDPATGQVRAMVGGRDFNASRFNRAVQARRQPGSAFKPFVYAAALEAGYTPASLIEDLNSPIATLQGAYVPADGHSSGDAMTLRTGLRTSSNRAAVRLLQEIGISRAVQSAKTMGVGDVPSVPSLALGSGEVTLELLTAAYAAFANRGKVPAPVLIRRVEDRNGNLLYRSDQSSTRAISETTAFLMSNMLADVINAGTAAGARSLGFKLPAAGKTGTTNDFNDAWFIGYTPKLVTGVWVGFDQPRTILPNGFAADLAVPFWTEFMKVATANDKAEWFTPPYGVTTASVCRISGKLASEGCNHAQVVGRHGDVETRSTVYTEYFSRGTEPTDSCEMHSGTGVFGAIAGIFKEPSPEPPNVTNAGRASTAYFGTPIQTRPSGLTSGTGIMTGTSGTITATGTSGTTNTTGRSGTSDSQIAPPPPDKERKSGFWRRIFGRGGDGKKN
jgi:1A family penicillin-binding protein